MRNPSSTCIISPPVFVCLRDHKTRVLSVLPSPRECRPGARAREREGELGSSELEEKLTTLAGTGKNSRTQQTLLPLVNTTRTRLATSLLTEEESGATPKGADKSFPVRSPALATSGVCEPACLPPALPCALLSRLASLPPLHCPPSSPPPPHPTVRVAGLGCLNHTVTQLVQGASLSPRSRRNVVR